MYFITLYHYYVYTIILIQYTSYICTNVVFQMEDNKTTNSGLNEHIQQPNTIHFADIKNKSEYILKGARTDTTTNRNLLSLDILHDWHKTIKDHTGRLLDNVSDTVMAPVRRVTHIIKYW